MVPPAQTDVWMADALYVFLGASWANARRDFYTQTRKKGPLASSAQGVLHLYLASEASSLVCSIAIERFESATHLPNMG